MTTADVRQSTLLAGCTQVEVEDVLRQSTEMTLEPGDLLFSDEDEAHEVWIIVEGELVVSKMLGDEEVVVANAGPGEYLGEISLLTASPARHRARAKTPTRLLRIPADVFQGLLRSCTAVTQTVLRTMAERVRRVERLLQERERMAALGTLAAGVAHELKNPAAAVGRAVELLGGEIDALEPIAKRLAEHEWSPGEIALLGKLKGVTVGGNGGADAVDPSDLDPIARSDREDALAMWLEKRGVDKSQELAALLAERGIATEQLDTIARGCEAGLLADALAWTQHMATIRQLLGEAKQSTTRISEMVRAVKAYSYVDKSSLRSADVHEGIESSLTILAHKLRERSVKVQREFDRTLPRLQVFGTELDQVWTNLIDNAADASGPKGGTIRVRTFRDGPSVAVEVTDNGAGIPPDVQAHIFDPFFTTKAAGKGTGLGLDLVKRIVGRHRGTITVASRPGETKFLVRVPIAQ
jgi:signal transduction histidine kinase